MGGYICGLNIGNTPAVLPAPADIRTRFPQFASLTDAQLQQYISDATLNFNQAQWGSRLQLGMSLYIAHQITMDTLAAANGNAGVLLNTNVSSRAGEVSSTRDASLIRELANNPFLATRYGQEYLRMRRRIGIGPVVL